MIEHALSAGRITEAVARDSLIDIIVVDLCVEKGLDAGFEAQLRVINYKEDILIKRYMETFRDWHAFAPWFDELCQADA